VNVPREFQEIGVFLTDNGLVAVLKEMSPALVSPVEIHHISCQQLPHAAREGLLCASK